MRIRQTVFLLACVMAATLPAHARASEMPRYHVMFDPATRSVQVRLCLPAAHAQVRFAADSAWAMRFVSDVRRESQAQVNAQDSGCSANDWHAGECLNYRADLDAIAAEKKPDVGWRLGTDLVAAPQLWLLRADAQGEADAQIEIELSPGWAISAPWIVATENSNPSKTNAQQSIVSSTTREFRIPNTPPDWSAAVALGHFSEDRIVLPGGVLRVVILAGVDAVQREKLHSWFARVAHAALGAYGRSPLPDVQVLMLPVDSRGEAVMFGQSVRGQGNALQLLVDPSRPEAEFAADWMAVHELSHLMHPYLGDRGAWLAEGLATYYQNILRARGGLLTPLQAWDRLAAGFKRATAGITNDTLDQAALNMHRTHAYSRVYWSGAAFWLTVDRDLRRQSNGKIGLDTALSRFRDCCLPAYREWRPEEFIGRLDALAGTALIARRYREFAALRAFPDWQSVYADLGIDDDGAHLRLDNSARDAAIREAIITAWRQH